MAVKVYVLLAMLVFAGVVMPIANAQLGGLGGLLPSLLGIITGLVPCSLGNSNNLSNGFANASVQMRCGGNVVGSSTTNSNGAFSIVTSLPTTLLSNLLGNCNVVVTTPLASCNASLPSDGILTAPLNLMSIVLGKANFVPGIFSFVPNTIG